MVKKIVTNDIDGLVPETSSQRILLEEYRLLQSRYIRTRDAGITRMNFFVTASSVALGGVLVFGSGTNIPFTYFRYILLVALVVLASVGLDLYNALIYRDIITDRYERGLARIRHYFVTFDPNIEKYFVNEVIDLPTNYLILRYSDMRRAAQIVETFLLSLAVTILSTYLPITAEISIWGGGITAILIFIILETFARRKLSMALKNAEKYVRFNA